ncbi:MAG: hypothetical protein GF364_15490, partial [Candidatus Lokiarchaeota archaeon]|nr:hypothetical protein [Candidatus Lokiarchaeota archaeon]
MNEIPIVKHGKLNAEWIWLDYITPHMITDAFRSFKMQGIKDEEKNRWALFRHTFSLNTDVKNKSNEINGKLKITADSRYKLYLNGTYIGRGIYRCNKHNWYYDEYDVSSELKPGKNLICVIVHYFGEVCSWYEQFPDGGLGNKFLGKGSLMFE